MLIRFFSGVDGLTGVGSDKPNVYSILYLFILFFYCEKVCECVCVCMQCVHCVSAVCIHTLLPDDAKI